MFIAVSGKGGTGKSTLSSLVVRYLVAKGCRPVLAVDADPNSTLGEKLGVTADLTIGDLRERASANKYTAAAGAPKLRTVEYEIQEAVIEGQGFDLLVMGRGEGPGCYCSVNNMLRQFLGNLASGYRHVVIDNEAGMEHLSRRTDHKVDVMLVVSDDTAAALKSARRIAALAQELGVVRGQMGLVINRATDEAGAEKTAASTDLALLGVVPWDADLAERERQGVSLQELPSTAPSVAAMNRILENAGL